MLISKQPFQQALIRAALERYKADLNKEAKEKTAAEKCLWIDVQGKTVFLTEKTGFLKCSFSSSEQRTAEICSLKEKGFTIIP